MINDDNKLGNLGGRTLMRGFIERGIIFGMIFFIPWCKRFTNYK